MNSIACPRHLRPSPGRHAPSSVLLGLLAVSLLFDGRAEERTMVLGTDDRTGAEVRAAFGRQHPFVAWTASEIAAFRTRLQDPNPIYRGTRYGWTHPTNGPVVQAAKGDPISCGKVFRVTGEAAPARKVAEFLLGKARTFKSDEFVALGCWQAPRELETAALSYDFIAGAAILKAEEESEVRKYLAQALDSLRRLEQYAACHNIGTWIDQAAWTTALCLEEEAVLKELFSRFKSHIGRGLLPGGYWYEGTAYGNMVRGNMQVLFERAARSGLNLAFLNCRRQALSPRWTVPKDFTQAGEILAWPCRMVAPFREVPNIGDGGPPSTFYSHGALTFGRFTKDAEIFDRYYLWDLVRNKSGDPHVWGDFPPNPPVEPLGRMEDSVWPDLGLFALRQGTGLHPQDPYVLFHALPRTGFHAHHDQGHVSLARYGRWLTGDIESSARSTGYQPLRDALSAARWAHNTVVVAGHPGAQEIDFPEVHAVSRDPEGGRVRFVDVSFSGLVEEFPATQRRQVLVTDDFVVVADDVAADRETTFDWFFHGAMNAGWVMEKAPGEMAETFLSYVPIHSEPDHNLTWLETFRTTASWKGEFRMGDKEKTAMRIWQLDTAGGIYSVGELTPPKHGEPGIHTGQRLHMICQRKTGKTAQFTAILEPCQTAPVLRSAELLRSRPNDRVLRIVLADGRCLRVFLGNGTCAIDLDDR